MGLGSTTLQQSHEKIFITARGKEGEESVPVEPGVGQADQEGHCQQEPLGPGQGDRGLHQKGVPRQGKQIRVVFTGIFFLIILANGTELFCRC
jgi:hypothetical protein